MKRMKTKVYINQNIIRNDLALRCLVKDFLFFRRKLKDRLRRKSSRGYLFIDNEIFDFDLLGKELATFAIYPNLKLITWKLENDEIDPIVMPNREFIEIILKGISIKYGY